MGRLCERPGCSEHAAVAYGMRPEDLVFWLDVLEAHHGLDSGVLCLRHADSMVVPRGWTLDDLRDPHLHLFRPPAADRTGRDRARRATERPRVTVEQLALGVDPIVRAVDDGAPARDDGTSPVAAGASATPVADPRSDPRSDPPSDASSDAGPRAGSSAAPVDPETPWTPSFDTADDLGGLLSARSPLLARAFRGDDRPR